MAKKYLSESIKLGSGELIVETGKVAKQADGSVVIRYGDTMLLVTAVSARTAREGLDFFPLTVEYRENTYAGGRIPGNYFRREGRPSEKEVLTCRLIDRPVRPLFADGYRFETQIVASVISRTITVSSEPVPDGIALLIEDTGVGMTQEQINNIMADHFIISSANVDRRKGNGLGYLIIKDLLKIIRGSLLIQSEKNKGTKVQILLPTPLTASITL